MAQRSWIRRRWPVVALALIVAAFPFAVTTYFLTRIGIVIALYALNAIGMTLLVRYAGVISIGQAGFFALGAYVSAILSVQHAVSPWLSIPVAAAAAVVCAHIFSIPFLRLRLIYLAMATLAFGEMVYLMAKELTELTGGVTGIPGIPHLRIGPVVLKEDWKIFYLAGGLVVVFAFVADNIGRSRVGRALHAIRTNETAARAMGIDVQRELGRVFCFSAFLAALSGAVLAHFITFISPESFTFLFSITLLIIAIIGGASVWGGLVTAVVLTGFSEIFRAFQDLSLGFYGLLLVVALFLFPDGLGRARRRVQVPTRAHTPARAPGVSGSEQLTTGTLLTLHGISKRFGGTQALLDVSMSVGSGRILGLIGPNGAGKTTLLNVVSGFVTSEGGRVVVAGHDVTRMPPHRRARRGIARTFQIPNLFKGMTVIENVAVGRHVRSGAGMTVAGLALPQARREEVSSFDAAADALDFVGLGERAYDAVESLPYGEQRLVELARALAMEPLLLLLDEPASGLNPLEATALGTVLLRVRDGGVAIVLVEHNMPLVMDVSDAVLVLHFGRRIAFGTPTEVAANDEVIAAYLGRPRRDA
jgi:branched-chain amino acid transport system ATP-binding protein/branched-chain amino acid transport system permease protein